MPEVYGGHNQHQPPEHSSGTVYNVQINHFNSSNELAPTLPLTSPAAPLTDMASRTSYVCLLKNISLQLTPIDVEQIKQVFQLNTRSFDSNFEMLLHIFKFNTIETVDSLYVLLMSLGKLELADSVKRAKPIIAPVMNERPDILRGLFPPQGQRELPSAPERGGNVERPSRTTNASGEERPSTSTAAPDEPEPSTSGEDPENFLCVVDNIDVLQSNEVSYSEHFDARGIYQIRNRPKGHVIIISNTDGFEHGQNREGGLRDLYLMTVLWGMMGFQTFTRENLKASEMESVLKSFSKQKFHSESDLCVIIIMSHGGLDRSSGTSVIHGIDFNAIPVDYVVSLFDNENCPILHRKPKLLFFQACRGNIHDVGVTVVPPNQAISQRGRESRWRTRRYPNANTSTLAVDAATSNDPHTLTLPTRSDIIVAQSSFPGYTSFRDSVRGSYFMNAITNVFMKKAHNTHVVDMMTEVKRALLQCNADVGRVRGAKMMADVSDSLTKRLYLFPGFPKQEKEPQSFKQFITARRKYDVLLEATLHGPMYTKILTSVDPTSLILHLYFVPPKIQHSVRQTRRAHGKQQAMALLLSEIIQFDDWGHQFLDALFYTGNAELAVELYSCMDEQLTEVVNVNNSEIPRDVSSPPSYSEVEEKSPETIPKDFVTSSPPPQSIPISIQDQKNALRKLSAIERTPDSSTPLNANSQATLHAQAQPASCNLDPREMAVEPTEALSPQQNQDPSSSGGPSTSVASANTTGELLNHNESLEQSAEPSIPESANNDSLRKLPLDAEIPFSTASLGTIESSERNLSTYSAEEPEFSDDSENEQGNVEIPPEVVQRSSSYHGNPNSRPSQEIPGFHSLHPPPTELASTENSQHLSQSEVESEDGRVAPTDTESILSRHTAETGATENPTAESFHQSHAMPIELPNNDGHNMNDFGSSVDPPNANDSPASNIRGSSDSVHDSVPLDTESMEQVMLPLSDDEAEQETGSWLTKVFKGIKFFVTLEDE